MNQGIRVSRYAPNSGRNGESSPNRWKSAAAPMFDSTRGYLGPKLKLDAHNGPRPSPGRKPVITGPVNTMYGGPETRGLADWDEPADRERKRPEYKAKPKGKLLARLVNKSGATTELRMVAQPVTTPGIVMRPWLVVGDDKITREMLVGFEGKITTGFKIITVKVHRAPDERTPLLNYTRRKHNGKVVVEIPHNDMTMLRTPPPTGQETARVDYKMQSDAFVDLPPQDREDIRIAREKANHEQARALKIADIQNQIAATTNEARKAALTAALATI